MSRRKKTDIVQFKVRLREVLRKQLEDAARLKDISLNSEIVSRLETSLVQQSLDEQIAVVGRMQKQIIRFVQLAEKALEMQEEVLLREFTRTENQLQDIEDVAWGKRLFSDVLSDVPDKEEIEEILRAALGRAPTDRELRAAARLKVRLGRAPTDEELRAAMTASDEELSDLSPRDMAARLKKSLGRAPTNEELSAAMRLVGTRRLPDNSRLWDSLLTAITQGQAPQQPRSVPDQLPDFRLAPDEIDEERPSRLRALADDLRKNAERNDARGAHDLGAEPREWDTRARSVPPRSSDQEAARATAPTRQSKGGSHKKA